MGNPLASDTRTNLAQEGSDGSAAESHPSVLGTSATETHAQQIFNFCNQHLQDFTVNYTRPHCADTERGLTPDRADRELRHKESPVADTGICLN